MKSCTAITIMNHAWLEEKTLLNLEQKSYIILLILS